MIILLFGGFWLQFFLSNRDIQPTPSPTPNPQPPSGNLVSMSGQLTSTHQNSPPTQVQFFFSSLSGIDCDVTQCLWTVSRTASAPPQYLTGSLDVNGFYAVQLPNNRDYSVTLAWVSQPDANHPFGLVRATCTGTPLSLQNSPSPTQLNISCTSQIRVFNP